MTTAATVLYFPGIIAEKPVSFPLFWQEFQGQCSLAQLEACDRKHGSHWPGLGM